MTLLINGCIFLLYFEYKRGSRRDKLICNDRPQQIEYEKSLLKSRMIWTIVGGIFIAAAIYMFLFCDTAVIRHYDEGLFVKAHDTKTLSWTGLSAYSYLYIGALFLLLGFKSYTKHDINALKYQSMSDFDYEQLRLKALEEKRAEEDQAKEIRKVRRNMKIGNAIGQFIGGL